MRKLEKAYRMFDWKDDPRTKSGLKRYMDSLKLFEKLIEHGWLKNLPENPTILDVCGGRGIGGVALAKILSRKGYHPTLTVLDIREEAVRDAEKFCREEGVACKGVADDALKAHRYGRFDIVLVYGAPLPHFDAWALPRLFSSVSEATRDDGVLLLDEFDRVHYIFTKGFAQVLLENADEKSVVVTFHKGYDPMRDVYTRLGVNLLTGEKVEVELTFRSIASIASLLWLFYGEIDIVRQPENYMYMVIARKPRRKISSKDLEKLPKVALTRREGL